jgi:hypothetical protein
VAFDVFISYSSYDKVIADAACAALESANIRCWIAPRDISPGRNYGESIIDAIESAKVFVLILSGTANTSPQISREVERAVSKGLVIVPVRIEDVAPSRDLEYFISSPHWLDAFPPPRERYFGKLVESVQALLGAEKTATTTGASANLALASAAATGGKRSGNYRKLLLASIVTAFAAASGGGYALWQFVNQPLVRTLTGHGADADSVSFSPDSKVIAAGGWDASIRIWNTATGQYQSTISGFFGGAAPYSPDGKTIAGGSDNNAIIWNATTGQILQIHSGHTDKVQTVAFSTDGKWLVSGGKDNSVYVWDAVADSPGRQLVGHTAPVLSVTFSRGGKWIASASFDQNVIVWDAATAQRIDTLRGTNKMNAAVFSPDDTLLATAGWDGNIRLWDTGSWLIPVLKGGDPRPPPAVKLVLPGNGQIVTTVAFSPDGKLIASGGYDDTVRIWNTATGAQVRSFTGHSSTIWAVGFSPDGKWIASASADKTVKIWKAP